MQCTRRWGNLDKWTPNSSALACACEKNSPHHTVGWHAHSAFQNQKYFPISILLQVVCSFTAWHSTMQLSSLGSFIWCFFPLLLGFYSCSFWLWLYGWPSSDLSTSPELWRLSFLLSFTPCPDGSTSSHSLCFIFYNLFTHILPSCASFQFLFLSNCGGSVPSPHVFAAMSRTSTWYPSAQRLYLSPLLFILSLNPVFLASKSFCASSHFSGVILKSPALLSYFPPCSTLTGSFTFPVN